MSAEWSSNLNGWTNLLQLAVSKGLPIFMCCEILIRERISIGVQKGLQHLILAFWGWGGVGVGGTAAYPSGQSQILHRSFFFTSESVSQKKATNTDTEARGTYFHTILGPSSQSRCTISHVCFRPSASQFASWKKKTWMRSPVMPSRHTSLCVCSVESQSKTWCIPTGAF